MIFGIHIALLDPDLSGVRGGAGGGGEEKRKKKRDEEMLEEERLKTTV